MKKEFTTRSAKETALLGKRLGSLINEKCTIAFRGGLGSGKTCFSVGVAQGLDYFGEANSPTFAIVNEYLGGRMPIYRGQFRWKRDKPWWIPAFMVWFVIRCIQQPC